MAPQLDKLDISDATIVSGGEQYISMADGEVYTSNYTISSYMFMDFHGSELKIPENTIRIENGSFWFLSKVENLTIPRSVREIGWNTFFACSSLKELEIPVSAKPIDENLGLWISNCSDLEIFKSLSSAIKISISQCDNLRIIELHGGINDNGIKDLPSLDTVTLCDGLTEIGIMNFQNCPSLTEITIPASVTNIAGNAFLDYNIYSQEGESSLREIHYKGSNSPWSYIDKNAFKKCKLYVPKSAISNFEKVSEFFETVIGE